MLYSSANTTDICVWIFVCLCAHECMSIAIVSEKYFFSGGNYLLDSMGLIFIIWAWHYGYIRVKNIKC